MAKTVGPDEYEKWGKFIKDKNEDSDNSLRKGWICPVCGRGLSPYTSVCPCKGFPDFKVTC